ncbi:MAG: phosphohistidine phosphatase SixA [Cellvibrionaceae bacterium]|nr:phosphohistidine phosphatase SixA [Cellvibrionaceae bacterium]
MELFLLRHGNAETHAERDCDRSLSALGRAELNSVFEQGVCAELAMLQAVFVSPYLRAQQTYAQVSSYLACNNKHDTQLLVPTGNPYQVVDLLYSQAVEQSLGSLLLISHQPLLGTVLNLVCGLEPGSHHMGTSCLAAIDMEIPGVSMGQLRWLKLPQV